MQHMTNQSMTQRIQRLICAAVLSSGLLGTAWADENLPIVPHCGVENSIKDVPKNTPPFGLLDCDIIVATDASNASTEVYSLDKALEKFNGTDETHRACRRAIKLHVPLTIEKPIEIKGKTLGDAEGASQKVRFTLDGNGNTINANKIKGCAITITTNYVTIKDLTIKDAGGDAICLKDDAFNVEFENVEILDAKGGGIIAESGVTTVHVNQGVAIVSSKGPGIQFKAPMLGMASAVHFDFDTQGDENPDNDTPKNGSVAFWLNGTPKNTQGIVTPEKFFFDNLKVTKNKLEGYVKKCTDQTNDKGELEKVCELVTMDEILIFRVGDPIINTKEQCEAIMPLAKKPLCDEKGAAAAAKPQLEPCGADTKAEGKAQVNQKSIIQCKGLELSEFLGCMGEPKSGHTNLIARAKVNKTNGFFRFNTTFEIENSEDAYVLLPVFAQGDAGSVVASSSCPFIPKKNIKIQKIQSLETGKNCPGLENADGSSDDDGAFDGGDTTGGNTGSSSGGSGGNTGTKTGAIYVEYEEGGKQYSYSLDEDDIIQHGFKNFYECNAAKEWLQSSISTAEVVDSDRDGIGDIYEDRNLNCEADNNETDLFHPDTDGDGVTDKEELGKTAVEGFRECYLIVKGVNAAGETAEFADLDDADKPTVDDENLAYDDDYIKDQKRVEVSPKDGKGYTVVPYLIARDDTTLGPCADEIGLTQGESNCKRDTLLNGLVPRGFEEGSIVGKGFCRGTSPLDPDTDDDGYIEGRELRPIVFTKKSQYVLRDLKTLNPIEEIEEGGSSVVAECDAIYDEKEVGRYIEEFTIKVKASDLGDYDKDGIENYKDNCPGYYNPDSQEDSENIPSERCGEGWDNGTIAITRFYQCMSDSVLKPGSITYYSKPAEFNTGDGQTNPFNIDTDSDGFCDGPVGPACVTASNSDDSSTPDVDERNLSQQDFVPWFKHDKLDGVANNSKDLPCKENFIYTFIAPKYRAAVRKAVEELFTAYTPGGTTIGMGYDVIAQSVLLHYEGQIQNIINANGGVTPPDLDEDGIWDVIESPDGKCTEKATHGFATSAYDEDSDDDGLGDMFDPCPNDDNAGTPFSDPLTASNTYEVEVAIHAKICNATGPNRYLANKALYCFLDWDQDGLKNCFEDFNISGVDPQTFINETNVKVADSDSDQLNDYLERYVHTTNPIQIDTDQDGLDDHNEVSRDGDVFVKQDTVLGKSAGTCVDAGQKDTDPKNKDTDGDGLDDGFELNITSTVENKPVTNPNNWDSDGDGLCDGGELVEGSIAKDKCKAGEDLNGDGIHPVSIKDDAGNVAVLLAGGIDESDPCTADTDGDTKTDETDECKTISHQSCTVQNKMGFDSDLDGIANLSEGLTGTDPTNDDTDGDGLIDGCLKNEDAEPVMGEGELCNQIKQGQFFALFNKLNKPNCGGVPYFGCDTDPGKMNNPEYNASVARDTDKDGMTDKQERTYPTNPQKLDTDGDGLLDGLEDTQFIENDDGTVTEVIGSIDGFFTPCTEQTDQGGNTGLVCPETNANDADTDKDGLPDGKIGIFCEDCNLSGHQDKIVEGLQIKFLETSPRTWDSDGDGNSDLAEATANGGFQKANIAAATSGATDSCSLVMSTQAPAPGLYLWYLLLAGLPIVLWERRRTRVLRA